MNYSYADNGERRQMLKTVERVVIKIGTQMLINRKGRTTEEQIDSLLQAVEVLRRQGRQVIVVSSGAIGIGMKTMQVSRRPKEMARLQAYAAIGQNHLMSYYISSASKRGFQCAQLLLTAADLHDFSRNQHVAECLDELLNEGVLPVINENDSVCTDEIKVGDNDTLAAYVAAMSRANLTILLTTVDGFHETRADGSMGERLSVVRELSDDVLAMAQGTDGNQFSTGGMITKLRAASIVNRVGDYMVIAGDSSFDILEAICLGEDIGTVFVPATARHMHSRQRFLAFFSAPTGTLVVDSGAEKALCLQNKSLLPGGILGSRGLFHRGDTVHVVNCRNEEIARGIVNFNYDEVARICGAKTGDIETQLGHQNRHLEVVHKDYLVLMRQEAK